MNILFAVHHFPPRFTGGAELRAFRTASALQTRGHTVRAVAVEYVDQAPDQGHLTSTSETYEGVEIHRLAFDQARSPDPFSWSYDNLWIGEFLQEQLARWQPDILHLIGGYLMSAAALRAARQRGIPRVVSLTDYWWFCPRIQLLRSDDSLSTLPIRPERCARCLGEEQRRYRLPGRLAPALMDLYWRLRRDRVQSITNRREILQQELNQADRIICPSRFLLDVHAREGIDPGRMIYARQGRDFPGLTASLLAKTPSDTLRIGYIGQITAIKGVHVLFEAVRRMSEAKVRVAAYGDPNPFPAYTAQLQAQAAQDPRLKLAGVYQRQEVSRVFQEMDVLVVPSLWYENSPNVILEAFAHRTPVIVSDLGGMAELVDHGKNGLRFAPADPVDLARQLSRLLAEPNLLDELRSGIGPVKTVREEMDELETLYRQLVPA